MNTPMSGIQRFLDKALEGKQEIRILEAGCGSTTHFRYKQRIHLTGIDVSAKQLMRNANLHEAILGDIQYYDFQPSSFDVIICRDVLEHLQRPELALLKFSNAIKQDGLIVLSLPNLLSLKSLATKYLPFRFHIWYYHHLSGNPEAGKEDVGPFRTYLKPTVTPNAIRRFANQNKLQVVYFDIYDAGDLPYHLQANRMARLVHVLYNMLRALSKLVSFGKLGDSDFTIVLRK